MDAATQARGSAERWGPLWGARADDWALSEEQQVPGYEAALERLGPLAGRRVLDVGCGAGVFLRLAADRDAEAFGVDASETLVALARRRVPEAEIRVGDMESLPYDDDSFGIVTGFTSFFFANDMVGALREAGRVATPGGAIVIQVWGAHERCSLEAMKEIARPFFPPRPADAPPDPDLSEPGALEGLAVAAGLAPLATFTSSFAYRYPDEETLGRALVAPGGVAVVVGPGREDEIGAAIVAGLASYRTADGSYRLENEFRYLLARA
jgi:SAM-dependent methyltransferase